MCAPRSPRPSDSPSAQVRVIVPDTGGGFGQKMHVMPEDLAVAAAARLINRPVKWIGDAAREPRLGVPGARGARGDRGRRRRAGRPARPSRARLVRCRVATHLPAHGPPSSPWAPRPSCRARTARPPMRTRSLAVATNKPPLGAYRGVGMTDGRVRVERALDLCRGPARPRSRRDPPAQPDLARRLSVHLRGGLRLRQRRLSDGPRDGARPRRLRARSSRSATPRGGTAGSSASGIACYTEYTGMGSETIARRGMVRRAGPRGGHRLDRRRRQRRGSRVLSVPGPRPCHDAPLRLWRTGSACRSSRSTSPAGHRRPRRPARGRSRAGAPSRRAVAVARRGGGPCGRAPRDRRRRARGEPRRPRAERTAGSACAVCPERAVSVAELARIAHSRGAGRAPRCAGAGSDGGLRPARARRSRAPSTWRPWKSIAETGRVRCARTRSWRTAGPSSTR